MMVKELAKELFDSCNSNLDCPEWVEFVQVCWLAHKAHPNNDSLDVAGTCFLKHWLDVIAIKKSEVNE